MHDYLLELLHNASYTTDEIIGLAIQTKPLGIVVNDIEPTLLQMFSDGELKLDGDLWERVPREPEPVEPVEAVKARNGQRSLFDVD